MTLPAEMQKYNSKLYIKTSAFIFGIAFFAIFLAFAPLLADAALVPCGMKGGPACEVCHLYTLANNLIRFMLWDIATPLLVIALLVAGFFWLTSAGSEEKVSKGKSILFSAVIGFIIVFGAWLIVNTLLTTLGYSSWTDTNLCTQSPIRSDATGGSTGTGTGIGTGSTGTGAGTGGAPFVGGLLSQASAQQQLLAKGITTESTGNCTNRNNSACTSLEGIGQVTVNRLIQFKQDCGCDVIITGGTEVGHSNDGACTHANGCKVDLKVTTTLRNYVLANYQPAGTRSDGARLYRAPNGTIFADEGDHLDVALP